MRIAIPSAVRASATDAKHIFAPFNASASGSALAGKRRDAGMRRGAALFRAINHIALMEVPMILHPSLHWPPPIAPLYRGVDRFTRCTLGSLHLDIEDTSFINNNTFGMKTVQRAVAQPPPSRSHFT